MVDYKALYFKLFAAIADATEEIENKNPENALEILIKTQREAEIIFIETDEE